MRDINNNYIIFIALGNNGSITYAIQNDAVNATFLEVTGGLITGIIAK